MGQPELFSTREVAGAFWLTLVLGSVLIRSSSLRQSIPEIIGTLLSRQLLVPVVLFGASLTLIVWLLSPTPIWRDDLTKEALFWFAIPGLSLFAKLGEVDTPGAFIRRHLVAMIALDFLLLAYLDIAAFGIEVELVLPPVATFLVAGAHLGGSAETNRRFGRLLAWFGVLLVLGTTWRIATSIASLDMGYVLTRLALPFWLTAAALPFVYALGLYEAYRMRIILADAGMLTATQRRLGAWRLLRAFGFRAGALAQLTAPGIREVAQAATYQDALVPIRCDQQRQEARLEAERQKKAYLVRFAGVKGTDEDGRQLDRREIEQTRAALDELATRLSGWYQNRGRRFRRQVLATMAHSRSGVSAADGLKLRVKRGGQAWMAWRRTPSGLVMALGGVDDPNDRRYYEGPTVPKGYPGEARGWDAVPGPNWW